MPTYSAAAPVFITPTNNQIFNIVQDTEFSYMITASDLPGNLPINFTDDSSDSQVGFYCFRKYFYNSTAWLINFTPENEDVGDYIIHIIAKNKIEEASLITVEFNVTNVNDPPYLISTSPINNSYVAEDQNLTLSINANDPDLSYGDNLSFWWYLDGILADGNEKLNSTKANSTHSDAIYNPLSEDFDHGMHNISITVKDSANASFNYTWTINVNNTNRPPFFNKTIANLTWLEDTDLIDNFSLVGHFYDLDTNGTQCEIDTLNCLEYGFIVTSGNASSIDIIVTQPLGNVSLNPALHWFGAINVSFWVDDGYAKAYSNNVTLTVTHINVPPEISLIPNQTTYANTYLSYLVNATDAEDDILNYLIFSPTLDDINITNLGLIELNSNSTHVGNHSINVTVDDGINSTWTSFNLEILPHIRPYIFTFPNITITQHSAYSMIINGSGDIAETLLFSTNWSTINPGQTFNTTAWNFTFTIDSQLEVGNHSTRIYISDNINSTNHYDCNIEVLDLEMPPEIFPVSVPNNQIKVNVFLNKSVYAFDEEGGILSFSDNTTLFNITTSDTGDMINNALGVIEFTPVAIGYVTINLSVIDTASYVDWTVFILNITGNHEPSFSSLDNITCNESAICTKNIFATDYDWQDSLIYGTNATDFAINPATGLINFTPSIPSIYNITVWVTDGTANISKEMVINILEVNNPPYFIENISLLPIWDYVTENSTTAFSLMAVDDENDSLILNIHFINFTNLANVTKTEDIMLFNFTSFDIHPNNSVTAYINFTPNSTQPGRYIVNISVSDNNTATAQVFSFFVHHIKSPPLVNWSLSYPYSSLHLTGSETDTPIFLNTTENTSININTSAFNIYYEPTHYSWNINYSGMLSKIGNQSDINYSIPFYAYPKISLVLYAISEDNATTTIIWNMNATNVNRQPVFGTYEYYFNSSEGTYNNTETENSILKIAKKNLTEYFNISSYISKQIDFKTTSIDLPRIEYTNITLINTDDNSEDYIIDTYTSTSTLLFNNNWIKTQNGLINSSDYRYLWFKTNITLLNTSKTPLINKAVIKYQLKNISVAVNTEYVAWVDLDHFFYDLDTDDSFNYSHMIISGNNLLNVSIVQDHFVALNFLQVGTAQIRFNATDQFGLSAESNIVQIEITSQSSDSQSSSSSSSSTKTKIVTNTNIEYRYQEQPEPIYLDIIYPLNVTIQKDETITVPILLKNNGDIDLSGIKVTAYADRPGLNLYLDKTELSGLPTKTEKLINLNMNMTEVYDSYTVYVAVNVTDPKYDATAKIIISSLKKNQEKNDSETLKLAFVSDLLRRNEECAELTEYVTRAKEYLNNGDAQKAGELLDKFINDCKILIKANQEKEDQPSLITGNIIKRIMENTDYLIITISIITLILITAFIALFHAYKKI